MSLVVCCSGVVAGAGASVVGPVGEGWCGGGGGGGTERLGDGCGVWHEGRQISEQEKAAFAKCRTREHDQIGCPQQHL